MRNMIKVVLTLLLLASLVTVVSAKQVDVGSGYTYTSDIQGAISSASSGDVVFVHAGTYNLPSNGHIALKSGVSLKGAGSSTTTLYGSSTTGGVSGSQSSDGWLYGSGVSNVEISGFTFKSSATGMDDGGHGETRNCILLTGSSNINIHDCYVQKYHYNDFVKIHGGSNIQIYNCAGQCGHDFAEFLTSSKNGRIYNCDIIIEINSGVRFDGVSGCEADHCTFTGAGGTGWNCIEAEDTLSNCQVDHNIFHDYHGSSGSWVVANEHAAGALSVHDNIIWNCGDIGFGTSTNNQINPSDHTIANWVAKGYGAGSTAIGNNNNNNNSGNGTNNDNSSLPAYNGSHLPQMVYPTHNATISTINGRVDFTWENVNSTEYVVEVANSSDFANDTIQFETLVDNGETILSGALGNGTYWWRIAAKDDVHSPPTGNAIFTDYTSSNKFTITGDEVVGVGGIAGVVFNSVSGHPINNSIVYLTANYWSGSCVTGSDGVYSFSNVASNVTYTVQATAEGYTSSPGMIITLSGAAVTQDIPLQKAQSYFAPNYVTVTVCAPWGTAYPNVQIDVYAEGNDPTNYNPDYSDTTDDNGQVVFSLDKAIPHYTIEAYSQPQNIDKVVKISPDSSNIVMWVWNAISLPISPEHNVNSEPNKYAFSDVLACEAVWQRNRTNTTYANINESFAAIDGVSNIEYWSTTIYEVDQFNGTVKYGANNQTTYFYYTAGNGDNSISVSVPTNKSYHVHTEIKDSLIDNLFVYDTQLDTRSTIMKGFDFGWKEQWNYELIGFLLLLFMGGLFGARSAAVGSVLVLLMGWLFEYIGWFVWSTGDMLMASFAIILVIAYFLLNGR